VPRRQGQDSFRPDRYEEEIDTGAKAHDIGGRRIQGSDYILDWLRATVVAEDPTNLYLFFLLLRSEPDVLEVQRVKNKFFDLGEPENIRTHVLVNVLLKYPRDAAAFAASGLRGDFDAASAGAFVSSAEIQLTLNDFLTIKELMHTYYEVVRAADPKAYILDAPIFVDPDTFAPTAPPAAAAAAAPATVDAAARRVAACEAALAAARADEARLRAAGPPPSVVTRLAAAVDRDAAVIAAAAAPA